MKVSEIGFRISLDEQQVPEKIEWRADDQQPEWTETSGINLSLWDPVQFNTPTINLWTKEMTIEEMKRFYVDCLGGMAQSILTATGDELMAQQMNDLCDQLIQHIQSEQG